MKLWLLALLFALNGCASGPYDTGKATALRLDFAEGVCSGVAVGRQTVLTAEHCLQGGKLEAINGQPATAEVIAKDGKDHVLLRVSVTFANVAKVGPYAQPGQVGYVWGNPQGIPSLIRVGYYMGPNKGTQLWTLNASRGDSGAAIYDAQGRIVGVVSAIAWSGPFAVTVAFPLAFSKEAWKEAVS